MSIVVQTRTKANLSFSKLNSVIQSNPEVTKVTKPTKEQKRPDMTASQTTVTGGPETT